MKTPKRNETTSSKKFTCHLTVMCMRIFGPPSSSGGPAARAFSMSDSEPVSLGGNATRKPAHRPDGKRRPSVDPPRCPWGPRAPPAQAALESQAKRAVWVLSGVPAVLTRLIGQRRERCPAPSGMLQRKRRAMRSSKHDAQRSWADVGEAEAARALRSPGLRPLEGPWSASRGQHPGSGSCPGNATRRPDFLGAFAHWLPWREISRWEMTYDECRCLLKKRIFSGSHTSQSQRSSRISPG